MKPDEARFHVVFNTVELFIERRYGIAVRISDVVTPFTGDLDGAEIQIDHDQTIEEALFILAHLFGHTVQWNISERAREIGAVIPAQVSEEQLAEISGYEREACRYSLQLFHDAGVRDMDQWFSDFATCDYAYLDHYYRTGEKREFRSFWRENAAIVKALVIPEFQPTQWVSRWKGTVL